MTEYTAISEKTIIPRKPHRCALCDETVDKTCIASRNIEWGRGFYTLYFHPECRDYTNDWEPWTEYNACNGGISRKEVRQALELEDSK